MTFYPAHIRVAPNATDAPEKQSVQDHCMRVAHYTSELLACVGLRRTGQLMGWTHDMGKMTDAFRRYIEEEAGAPGKVIHTFQGVRCLFDVMHLKEKPSMENLACELIAYAVGAHHGLFDVVDRNSRSGFSHRLTHAFEHDEASAVEAFFLDCMTPNEFRALCRAATGEVEPLVRRMRGMTADVYGPEWTYFIGCLERLMLSALIEADRRDTAEFMTRTAFDDGPRDMRAVWSAALNSVERKLNALDQSTAIARVRREISDMAMAHACDPTGIFRLRVPTGGGKTLAALRFTVAHARTHGMARIFFIMPLLAITEQNAKVIREYLNGSVPVLEHYADAVHTDGAPDEMDKRELLCETWTAPVIVTTLAQFLMTLFSGKTGSVRRFNALAQSVIVIDEVQSVPSRMLSQFNLMIRFLCEICGATVVLCSATQPCLEAVRYPMQPIRDLIEEDLTHRAALRRTRIIPLPAMKPEQLAEWTVSQMDKTNALLVICNTRLEARTLSRALDALPVHRYHLSAAMCQAHRRRVMDDMQRLERERKRGSAEKTLCIATQVMQSGVDMDFECVARLLAGLDDVVQAAGRCNRHGDRDVGEVYLIPVQNEKLSAFLADIRCGQNATERVLARCDLGELESEASVSAYYRYLYDAYERDHTEYPLPGDERTTMVDLLSLNMGRTAGKTFPHLMAQAFKTAGDAFEVYDSNSREVIVPYAEGAHIISQLGSARAQHDVEYARSLLIMAKPYMVSVYGYEMRLLTQAGGIAHIEKLGVAVLKEGFYSEQTGVTCQGEIEFLHIGE